MAWSMTFSILRQKEQLQQSPLAMINPCNSVANGGNGNAPHYRISVLHHLSVDPGVFHCQLELPKEFSYSFSQCNFQNGLIIPGYCAKHAVLTSVRCLRDQRLQRFLLDQIAIMLASRQLAVASALRHITIKI